MTSCRALMTAIGLAVICDAPVQGADQGPVAPTPRLRMPDTFLSLRDMYPDLSLPSPMHEFTREFRPRPGPALSVDPDHRAELIQSSAWERIGDYRSTNGLRLLTVWQAADSTLALHEGKHGGASLQWTSNAMSRGSATRGLLDHLVSTVRSGRPAQRPAAGSGSAGAGTVLAPAAGASRTATP
jgi:hypothetical protein